MSSAITRRQFAGMCLAASAYGKTARRFHGSDGVSLDALQPPQYTFPVLNQLPRPQASEIAPGDPYWALLRKAYILMGRCEYGACPPSSLFLKFAALHEQACSGTQNIHYSPNFLVWHRGLLYFHERAINRVLIASGDIAKDSIRLPSWNWDRVAGPVVSLPSSYLSPASLELNPLYEQQRRQPSSFSSGFTDQDAVSQFLSAPDFTLFKTLLNGVHNMVHEFVGGLMQQIPTAGFDPVFYAHHVNVDRLLQEWLSFPDNLHQWPASSGSLLLLDETGAPVQVRPSDFFDISKLGYSYPNLPSHTVEQANAPRLRIDNIRLRNQYPGYVAFLADVDPHRLGKTLDMDQKGVVAYSAPAQSMQEKGRLSPMNLSYVWRKPRPTRMIAVYVGKGDVIQGHDKITSFSVESVK
ncbi:MAG TPA: tyrosinase family protein [Bryobacteraceae bacterium]|nr:tyrosinase family protein [Bryobacteraceae bacterium]